MAVVYGKCGAVKELLRQCPSGVKTFSDIKKFQIEYNKRLDLAKKKFEEYRKQLVDELVELTVEFDKKLPNRIKAESKELDSMKSQEERLTHKYNKMIADVDKAIQERKDSVWKKRRIYLIFSLIGNWLKKRRIQSEKELVIGEQKNKIKKKAKQIKRLKNNKGEVFVEENKEIVELSYEVDNNPEYYFVKENKKLIDKIDTLESARNSVDYIGAKGELQALTEFEKLSDDYHILCDCKISLDQWSYYKGEYIGSAQMDFVIVCRKGVFLIEVKAWGNDYIQSHRGISPHEQTYRAGRVLYKTLQEKTYVNVQRRVTKILIPIYNNLYYRKDFSTIFVKNLYSINNYIQKKKDVFSNNEVKAMVKHLSFYT